MSEPLLPPALKLRAGVCIFLLGALVAVLAARQKPLVQPRFTVVWSADEQLLPVAVSPLEAPRPPRDREAFRAFMAEHAVTWRAATGAGHTGEEGEDSCALFLRMSERHWARLDASRERLAALLDETAPALSVPALLGPGEAAPLWSFPVASFLDDDDRDGDPLDAGEIAGAVPGAGSAIEAVILCPP